MAGYEGDMNEMLATNDGLRSRFPRTITFRSYTPEEIFEICKVVADNGHFEIDEAAREVVVNGVRPLLGTDSRGRSLLDMAGNGRFARNLTERAQAFHKDALGGVDNIDDLTDEEMFTLTAEDFSKALETLMATIIAPSANY